MTRRRHDVVVVGDGSAAADLRAAGIDDVMVIGGAAWGATFDDGTDTWTLTAGDEIHQARIVVTCASPLTPFIPDLLGRRAFRGTSFHAATPDPDFDPTGRRVAVIGPDSNAGRLIETMVGSAAEVTVFPRAPRRVVSRVRRTIRVPRRRQGTVVGSPCEQVTTAGIRTADGEHYDADTIVYGTGFAVADGAPSLTGLGGMALRETWIAGAEPYLGVAMYGFPNYFMLDGTDRDAALRSVIACLRLAAGKTRVEVRRSSQQVFNERVHLHGPPLPAASAFDLSSALDLAGDVYDGAATLTIGDHSRPVRVRLIGHTDPIDGQYHWQGMVFDRLPAEVMKRARTVSLAVGDQSAPARITEETPQGKYSIAGVGSPPFVPADSENLTRA